MNHKMYRRELKLTESENKKVKEIMAEMGTTSFHVFFRNILNDYKFSEENTYEPEIYNNDVTYILINLIYSQGFTNVIQLFRFWYENRLNESMPSKYKIFNAIKNNPDLFELFFKGNSSEVD